MPPSSAATVPSADPARDIVFACQHCGMQYVVDAAAAGVTLQCQKCSHQTTVPTANARDLAVNAAQAAVISDLQHQLKENESQRTEITSYINQLSIQLHRWQLRLKTLNERQQKLQTELQVATSGTSS